MVARRSPARLARRGLLRGGLAGVALAAGGLGSHARAAPPRVRVLAFEGQFPHPLRARLEADSGLSLDVTVAADADEAWTRIGLARDGYPEPGVDPPFDLIALGLEDVARWRAAGLLAPLPDMARTPIDVRLHPLLTTQGALDADGTTWLAPLALGATVMIGLGPAAESLALGEGPPGWDALLAEPLAGRIALEPHAAVWIGLHDVDPDGTRLAAAQTDTDTARALFKEVQTALQPYRAALADVWTDVVTFRHRFAGVDPQALAGCAWDDLARSLGTRTETPIATAIPKDGAPAWLDGLAIPRNAVFPDRAARVLAALADPETAAVWGAITGWLPADPRAWALAPAPTHAWIEAVLQPDGALSRLWVPPALTGPAAEMFDDARSRFEFP